MRNLGVWDEDGDHLPITVADKIDFKVNSIYGLTQRSSMGNQPQW